VAPAFVVEPLSNSEKVVLFIEEPFISSEKVAVRLVDGDTPVASAAGNLEAAPIGRQLFAHGDLERLCKAY
jgi:hypothetical protein